MAVPLRSIEFDISELDEVMELAVMIDRKFPEGLPTSDTVRNASNERLLQMIREADEKPKDEKPSIRKEDDIHKSLAFQLIDTYNRNNSDGSLKRKFNRVKKAYLEWRVAQDIYSEKNLEFEIKSTNEYKAFSKHFQNQTRHTVGNEKQAELIDKIRYFAGDHLAVRLVYAMFAGMYKNDNDYFYKQAPKIYNEFRFIFLDNPHEIISKGKQYADEKSDGLSDMLVTDFDIPKELQEKIQNGEHSFTLMDKRN